MIIITCWECGSKDIKVIEENMSSIRLCCEDCENEWELEIMSDDYIEEKER